MNLDINNILEEQASEQFIIDDITHQHEMEQLAVDAGTSEKPPQWWVKSRYALNRSKSKLSILQKQEKLYFEQLKTQRHEATLKVRESQYMQERDFYEDAINDIEAILTKAGDNPMIRSIINNLDTQIDRLRAEIEMGE